MLVSGKWDGCGDTGEGRHTWDLQRAGLSSWAVGYGVFGKFFWKHKDGLGWWCQREDKGNRYKKRSQKYFTKKYAKVTEVSWHESTPTPPSRPGLAWAGECCRALKPYKSILLSLLMGFPPLCFSLDFGDVSLSPLYWVFPWLCSVECGLFILGISITPSKTEYSTCNVTPSPIPYLPFHSTSAAMQSSLPYSVCLP